MICTVEKCWPGALGTPCSGNLEHLSLFSSNPTHYLQQTSSFSKLFNNPEYTRQVWLSKLTASEFTSAEISSFTICESHQKILEKVFSNRNASVKSACSVCGRKRNVRKVTHEMHKSCFRVFNQVIPIAASICQDCRTALQPKESAITSDNTVNADKLEDDSEYEK